MSLNIEAVQLVVGAAIIDQRFCDQLLRDRERALRAVERLPVRPRHVRLSAADRRALEAIRGQSLVEFARGVERLRRTVQSPAAQHTAPPGDAIVG